MGHLPIKIPYDQIEKLCKEWRVSALELFGSILHEGFSEDSDVDILVTFVAGETPSLFGLTRLTEQLSDVFGRKVDLVVRRAIEKSRNPERKKGILQNTKLVYGKAA